MAAASSVCRLAPPAVTLPKFPCSPFTVSSLNPKLIPQSERFPLSRSTTCSASLLAPELPRVERLNVLKMESAFTSLRLDVDESLADGAVDRWAVEQRSRAHWRIVEAAREEDRKDGGAVAAPLAWRDASLRYANVMWFKGAYNVEIVCTEDEPEESIVRRFRQKVVQAGVIRECQRRRYRETRQDTIKRKRKMASQARKRRPSKNASNAWTQNAWRLSRDHLKPADHSKKKKSPKKSSAQSRFDARKKGGSEEKVEEPDDDYWGYVEEENGIVEDSSRRSSG